MRTVYRKIGKEIEAKSGSSIEEDIEGAKMGEKKPYETVFCSTAPINSGRQPLYNRENH